MFRAATLAAVRKAGEEGLGDDEFGRKVQAALGFTSVNKSRRAEWLLRPETLGAGVIDAERTLARVLTHRVWADQRRGWRYTNPSLEELRLVRAVYVGLDELAEDANAFTEAPPEIARLSGERRKKALRILLETLRRGLAVTTEALDAAAVDAVKTASRQTLRHPWAIGSEENPRIAAALIVRAPGRMNVKAKDELLILRGGPQSRLAKQLNRKDLWGERLKRDRYLAVVTFLLELAEKYQLVRKIQTAFDVEGWQLSANAVRLMVGEGAADRRPANRVLCRFV